MEACPKVINDSIAEDYQVNIEELSIEIKQPCDVNIGQP